MLNYILWKINEARLAFTQTLIYYDEESEFVSMEVVQKFFSI